MYMPSLSPTMTQGNIIKWKKQEGEKIAPGDVLGEIETDKATIEWEAQEEGVLAKILAPEGSKDVPCGQLVAILVEEGTDISAFASFDPSAAPKQSAQASEPEPEAVGTDKPAENGASAPRDSLPPHTKLEMPSLSPTMDKGNLVEWKKEEGEEISTGDVIAAIETDKATMEWESQDDGFLAKILVPAGTENVKVGTQVAVVVEDKADVAAFAGYTGEDSQAAAAPSAAPPEAAETPQPRPQAEPSHAPRSGSAGGPRIIASPYARSLAARHNVSLEGVAGSGPGGRIVAADVEELVASGGAKPKAETKPTAAAAEAFGGMPPFEDIPVSQIKKITAQRLQESKQTVPHFYLSVDCRVDELMALRSQLNKTLEKDGVKISVNDFIIKAAAAACSQVPECNASWQGEFVRRYKSVDMSVAVQTEHGLMVPIVKGADGKGLAAISADVQRLAAKAREGKLAPHEFMGGTFTISNLGMFGIKSFSAIINPPQACILAVGAADKRVVPGEGGGFDEVTVMNVTLSCDHRVVDGAVGAQWVKAFKGYIEQPLTLML